MLRIALMPMKSVRCWMDNERASERPSLLYDEVNAEITREGTNGAVHTAASIHGSVHSTPTYILLHRRERREARIGAPAV